MIEQAPRGLFNKIGLTPGGLIERGGGGGAIRDWGLIKWGHF